MKQGTHEIIPPTNSNLFISVVIPVYNGEKSIEPLVESVFAALSPYYRTEVVMVNDGSEDNSAEACIRVHKRFPESTVFVNLSRNFGEHNAVLAGLAHTSGDYAGIIDDDFQNPPEEIIALVEHALKCHCDVVYSFFDKKKHSLFRNLGSRFNDRVATIMLKKPRDLYLSSFKVLSRFLINEVCKYQGPFPYLDGIIFRISRSYGKVKVRHNWRMEGKSNYNIHRLIRLWLNMFTNFSILPLRLSIVLGLMVTGIGLVFGMVTVIERLRYPNVPAGYASLMILFIIFSGVQLTSLGMIGEYLGRIFFTQNGTPLYIVKEVYRSDGNKRI
ncbi:MAG: glycosyltransferase family 2 protein [Acidobacteria bacterium]|nr:glycosyltransferase family 2 protein [Acidobacteriota bacterium]MBI3655412.1 glycosyltransferase family 2 protein [Acidobacteriota bacterium]